MLGLLLHVFNCRFNFVTAEPLKTPLNIKVDQVLDVLQLVWRKNFLEKFLSMKVFGIFVIFELPNFCKTSFFWGKVIAVLLDGKYEVVMRCSYCTLQAYECYYYRL